MRRPPRVVTPLLCFSPPSRVVICTAAGIALAPAPRRSHGPQEQEGRREQEAAPPHGVRAAATTNADWEDSTAAFRKEAESAIRARSHDDGCAAAAAARLAERHPASPLAHHILGHARASIARAGDAVPRDRRHAELAPRCPGIAATLASALLYAPRPGEALVECARALDVADPTDPALHDAAAAASSRRAALTATCPQARVAAARERLFGVRADAEALEAAGARHDTAPPPPPVGAAAPTTKTPCCCRHATTRKAVTDDDLRGFLTVNLDDLRSYCDQTGGVHLLTRAVEFAKATKAWAYWLCPVCDMVFLDASSFMSHVEGEYIDEFQELQPLIPKRASLDSDELLFSLKWTPLEMGKEEAERRRNLDTIKNVFSGLNTMKALPVGLTDKVIKFARGRSKKPLPYCIPSCITSLDSTELQRLIKPLDQLYNNLSRGWEFVRILGDEGKNKGGRSDIISLVQDGSLLSLDTEKVASRKKDGSCEDDALFRWLLNSMEEVAIPWASLRQKCVHHGNEVLERIYGISDLLLRQFDMKCAAKKKNHRGYSLTEADSIDVEMLLLDNEVSYLKSKLVEVCTFDYSAAILPLIRAYIWDKLNNSTGEDSQDWDDKDAVNNGDGLDNLHEESLLEDKIPDTDSHIRFTISRTDDCENSSLSQSDSPNFSKLETEISSIDSGVGSVLDITAEGLLFLNVTLRALWHLREFHDRFLDMPLVLPHLTVEAHCIICPLRRTFKAWDSENDFGVTAFPHDVGTAFSDILNDHNLFGKEGMNIASEIISTILESLHKSHTSLHSYNANIEHQLISTSRCFDLVCVAHNVFGLPIREQKKCICLNESSEEKEYISFFHSVDVSAIPIVEMKSLGQLLRDADRQFQFATENCQCGNKTEHSLLSEPPIFSIVFNWPIDKHSRIDMSEVLINITTPLQFDILYYNKVRRPEDYTLATAICCLEEEYLCFARKEERWIIYGSKTVEFADSWECLLHRYRHRSLQILFFDRVRSDSSMH